MQARKKCGLCGREGGEELFRSSSSVHRVQSPTDGSSWARQINLIDADRGACRPRTRVFGARIYFPANGGTVGQPGNEDGSNGPLDKSVRAGA